MLVMASAFSLSVYPWVYLARFDESERWTERFIEQEHLTPQEEARLDETELAALLARRNHVSELPLVNYTTQYALGCFEGLKALPQPDGSLKIFRPDQNGLRMHNSMNGLLMPALPVESFVGAVAGVVARNAAIGFAPDYDPAWEKDNFLSAASVYIRPFTYAEPGIGVNPSRYPWVVIMTTRVGSYFDPDADTRAITTDRPRAAKGGTGWIKCNANYVASVLVRHEVQQKGYMEAIFLDAETKTYVEEGSSSNIFFLYDDDTLVTPTLEDTILPGITRSSVMQLATDRGITVVEKRVPIAEAMDRAVEAFVTGTAAGITYLQSLTHHGSEKVLRGGKMGELTRDLLLELKGIQYGAVEDRHGWMTPVPVVEPAAV